MDAINKIIGNILLTDYHSDDVIKILEKYVYTIGKCFFVFLFVFFVFCFFVFFCFSTPEMPSSSPAQP